MNHRIRLYPRENTLYWIAASLFNHRSFAAKREAHDDKIFDNTDFHSSAIVSPCNDAARDGRDAVQTAQRF